MPRKYVTDDKLTTAPDFPTDRPPTRAEVWAYVTHVYDGLWDRKKMEAHSKACWAGNYVRWVNLHGWRKLPDWTEGEDAEELELLVIPVDNANYDYVKGLM